MPNRDGSLTFDELVQLFKGGGSSLGGGLMQGITPATQQPVEQGVMGSGTDDLNPVNMTSMVNTNNDSGTNPLMMVNNAVADAGGSLGFPDANNYQMDATQAIVNSMTDDEHNVYMQLEDFQIPAFLQAIQENKISQYEAENFNRLRTSY